VLGACVAGYSGNPYRLCENGGIWSASVSPLCIINQCPAITEGNATWAAIRINSTAYGTCENEFYGTPTRTCLENQTWSPIQNPCQPDSNCTASTYANADWPQSSAGNVQGTCAPGFTGTPYRNCFASGIWSTSVTPACNAIQCSGITENNSTWAATNALSTAYGTCVLGFSGTPSRTCSVTGTWGAIQNPCQPNGNCTASTYGLQTFPATGAGTYAQGTCLPGAEVNSNGFLPERFCKPNGVWATYVSYLCQRIQCQATQAGNANFPTSNIGSTVIGTCISGQGSPKMFCNDNGSWGNVQGSCS